MIKVDFIMKNGKVLNVELNQVDVERQLKERNIQISSKEENVLNYLGLAKWVTFPGKASVNTDEIAVIEYK